jgi:hybrid cluster-associated redox disulfide protein
MTPTMAKITKKTILNRAMKDNPNASKVFARLHMGCASCQGQINETVEWAAVTHGVAVDDLVKALNAKG